jgi:hypothetical protein
MQEIITFVQDSIMGGVAYDGIKIVLGSSFTQLYTYLSNNQNEKFEGALEMLFEQNEDLKQKIIELQNGGSVTIDNSIKIGGNNSGVNIIGNNNDVNRK